MDDFTFDYSVDDLLGSVIRNRESTPDLIDLYGKEIDDDDWTYDLDEKDDTIDDDAAFQPIDRTGFYYNLDIAREHVVPDITPEKIKEIIRVGKTFSTSLDILSKEEVSDRKVKEVIKSIDPQQYFGYNYETELDVDFSIIDFMKSNSMDIFRIIRQQILNGNFKMSLRKKDPSTFLDQKIVYEISKIINKKKKDFKISDIMKQIHHDKQFHLKIFEAAFEKFFKTQKKFLLSKDLFEKKEIDDEIRKILSYDDTKQKIKFEILQTVFLVYITSGGGKTSQFKGNKLYYEVDDLVKDHNTSFQKFRSFCVTYKREDHLNLWFKYTISQNMDKIIGKILVMNHPNQVPNCLRYRINELIIIPKQLNWRTRFFSENFISLISCKDYRKVALPYVEYKSFIEKYFKVGENGKILDNLVFEILKDLGPNEKQEQEIEEAYSSYLDGYEMVNFEENE